MSSGTDNSTDLSSSSSNSYVINERIDKEDSRRRRKAPAPVVNKSKKKQWWQRNMVRQTATFVQADVDAITNNSSFLKQNHPEETNNLMAYFNRSEIQTGCVVGQGGFSIVYEIVAFHLDPDLSRQMKPEYQAIREQYAVTALDPQTGQGRYVIKHLQEHLLHRKADYSIAASDMALEAEYLRRIDHPHIVKLRGLPVTGVKALEDGRHDGYFLILDRLEETLDQRIKSWKKMEDQEDKLTVHAAKIGYAKNLASALEYLHGNRIIYRDLKPQNVGFDVEGNIQLFDFGLCRELPDGIADMEDVYEMSGVGTRRFMAPEIILDSHYNAKADVYSWSMVVWQMFTLEKPYAEYTISEHTEFVCKHGERPSLNFSALPPKLRVLLSQAWCESVATRASIVDVASLLEAVSEEEPTDDSPTVEEVVVCQQLQFDGMYDIFGEDSLHCKVEAFTPNCTVSSSATRSIGSICIKHEHMDNFSISGLKSASGSSRRVELY